MQSYIKSARVTMNILGKVIMTLAIAIYTFIPPLVDLTTESHVFHEGWMPHARMHTVWLLGITTGIGLISLYFLWVRQTEKAFGTNLAGVLSGLVYGAFFLSAATTSFYGGALSDLIGGVEKGPFGIDSNLFTFGITSLVLFLGWITCARSRS